MGIIDAQPADQNQNPPPDQNPPANTPEAGEPAGNQDAGGEQPSPAEQGAMERVVLACMSVIYGEETHQGIVDLLSQGKADPATALANTATVLITQVDKKSGGKDPGAGVWPPPGGKRGRGAS